MRYAFRLEFDMGTRQLRFDALDEPSRAFGNLPLMQRAIRQTMFPHLLRALDRRKMRELCAEITAWFQIEIAKRPHLGIDGVRFEPGEFLPHGECRC
jgi:hypothetical protein